MIPDGLEAPEVLRVPASLPSSSTLYHATLALFPLILAHGILIVVVRSSALYAPDYEANVAYVLLHWSPDLEV